MQETYACSKCGSELKVQLRMVNALGDTRRILLFPCGKCAGEQLLEPNVCSVCRGKKGSRDAFDEWYPCQTCNGTGKHK